MADIYHKLHTGLERDPDDDAPISAVDWDDAHVLAPHSIVADDLEQGLLDGITGPPGPVGMVWRGAWESAAEYSASDVVSHDGSSYICTAAHTDQQPPNGLYWDSLAERGATWWEGHGTPTVVVGASPGDYYLDLDSGLVYKLT